VNSTAMVGLIGQGPVARMHAAAWRGLGVPFCVFAPSGAATFADEFGASEAASLGDLLDRCDIVDICTPTPTHRELVDEAARAGKHVICEKPLAHDYENARSIRDVAEAAGINLVPAHVVRYFEPYRIAHSVVREGGIGELAVLRFSRSGVAPQSAWYHDTSMSGGIILDQMIHDIDQALWIAGSAVRVFATITARNEPDHLSSAHVVLTHDSGAISHCRGNWAAMGAPFRYSFHLAGTGGTLAFDSTKNVGFATTTAFAPESEHADLIPTSSLTGDPFQAQLAEALGFLTRGTAARVSIDDGVEAVRVARAAVQSAELGRAIELRPEGEPA